MMSAIPPAKPPHLPLPNIRGVPSIPNVGSAGANACALLGEQFASLPDLNAALHIKARKKQLEEMIQTLIEGYVPAAARQPVWATRVTTYTNYISELVTTLNAVIGAVTAEANASKVFINGKISEVNALKNQILAVPEGGRSRAQQLALTRYNEYVNELNAQVTRLNTVISSIAG